MVAAPAQIASRGVTIVPLGKHSIELNLLSLLLAWSITEIVRYSFFAFKVKIGKSNLQQPWLMHRTAPIALACQTALSTQEVVSYVESILCQLHVA